MHSRTWAALSAVVVIAAGGAGAVLVEQARSSATNTPGQGTPTSDAAGPTTASAPPVTHTAGTPAVPLRVVSISHAAPTSTGAALGAITVTFSAPVVADPTLTPALSGTWTHPTATTAVFAPAHAPLPGQKVTVTLPVAFAGRDGGRLGSAVSTSWVTRSADPARLQQLLAEAGYLPLTFAASSAEPTTAEAVADSAYAPVAGRYAWRFTAPSALQALYTGASSPVLTRGAVLAFQSRHDLSTDGVAGPAVWSALTADVAAHRVNPAPYTNVVVSKGSPETMTLYQNGVATLTTRVNTGVAGAATPDGSWPVYARYVSQTMSGTNPAGSHYSDPGVPWINYFTGGDAVHGFPRSSYGSPQSVGCVELPIPTAKVVYGLMGYGDIVTVRG